MKASSLFVAAATGTLAVGYAVPASASSSGDTTVTINIIGGPLDITVPPSLGNLFDPRKDTATAGTISRLLGQVQVHDRRRGAAGSSWIASATSTDFTPLTGPSIPASAVSYAAGTIVKVGTATYTADDPASLADVSAVVTATDAAGVNTASWNPIITVAVPADVAANAYSATITHSVV
jgi:hypothetical protein